MLRTICTLLLLAHMVGCSSALVGYMFGVASGDGQGVARQLQKFHYEVMR